MRNPDQPYRRGKSSYSHMRINKLLSAIGARGAMVSHETLIDDFKCLDNDLNRFRERLRKAEYIIGVTIGLKEKIYDVANRINLAGSAKSNYTTYRDVDV